MLLLTINQKRLIVEEQWQRKASAEKAAQITLVDVNEEIVPLGLRRGAILTQQDPESWGKDSQCVR